MIKKITSILVTSLCIFQLTSVSASSTLPKATEQAQETKQAVKTLSESRNLTEVQELKEIYATLFPNEYHYIEEYDNNGAKEMDTEQIYQIFNDSKVFNNQIYELTVMSNGQIFLIISDNINPMTRASTQSGRNFKVGDLNSYNTFYVTYTINRPGYDKINSWKVSGTGFILYPTNKAFKQTENSSGPAYIRYNNVAMTNGATSILYDIGVAVGNNQAKSITKISSGTDSWLWYILNALQYG